MTTDSELVIRAQAGDIVSLGLLIERHRAALYALALSILRFGPDAQDAVQDTSVLALSKIGTLRDPESAAAWLRGILRNVCLNQIRRQRDERPLSQVQELLLPAVDLTLERHIDQLALRDWVWTALDSLPDALQSVALLRYFGNWSSYAEIAQILDIPVGTVRSRLNQVRLKLADALLDTLDSSHDAIEQQTRHSEEQFAELCRQHNAGRIGPAVAAHMAPEVRGFLPDFQFQGRDSFLDLLRGDSDAGVKLFPTQVLAGSTVVVYEARWENPPTDPDHCPPAMAYVEFIRDELVHTCRVYHAPADYGAPV